MNSKGYMGQTAFELNLNQPLPVSDTMLLLLLPWHLNKEENCKYLCVTVIQIEVAKQPYASIK